MGSYERTDGDIAQAALNAFEWSYSIPHNLKVSVEKGWITLKGEVDWDFERVAAKDAVSQLMGVRGVSSELTIKEKAKATDVKHRIDEALSRSALNEGNKINIAVDGGRVTLSGNVSTFSEMGDAALAAWFAPGVTRVDNNLQLSH
jgi:osmotically-inducible protein OsmY